MRSVSFCVASRIHQLYLGPSCCGIDRHVSWGAFAQLRPLHNSLNLLGVCVLPCSPYKKVVQEVRLWPLPRGRGSFEHQPGKGSSRLGLGPWLDSDSEFGAKVDFRCCGPSHGQARRVARDPRK